MKYLAALVVLLSATSVPAADLPPHVIPAGGGWYSCERGYVMTRGECLSEETIAALPKIEVSSLPSAGDGSRQPTAASTQVIYVDRYVSPYSRYNGPFPDRVYDRIQSRLSPGARVVPFTLGW